MHTRTATRTLLYTNRHTHTHRQYTSIGNDNDNENSNDGDNNDSNDDDDDDAVRSIENHQQARCGPQNSKRFAINDWQQFIWTLDNDDFSQFSIVTSICQTETSRIMNNCMFAWLSLAGFAAIGICDKNLQTIFKFKIQIIRNAFHHHLTLFGFRCVFLLLS